MHGIDKALEEEWFNRFGQHHSYFINEWTEINGTQLDWSVALRHVLDNIGEKENQAKD